LVLSFYLILEKKKGKCKSYREKIKIREMLKLSLQPAA